MKRLILAFAALMLGLAPQSTAQSSRTEPMLSLEMAPHSTETREREGVSQGGQLIVRSLEDEGSDEGSIVYRQAFFDDASLIDAHGELMVSLFGTSNDQCVLPADGEEDRTKKKKEKKWPGWIGRDEGGCGTWAVQTCNRRLGIGPKTKVGSDKDEWNEVAKGIGQGENGASSADGRAGYYKGKGFCSTDKSFSGSDAAYKEIERKLKLGYDIKIRFRKIVPWGLGLFERYENGHVETIVGIEWVNGKPVIITESWGRKARITGGSRNNFGHDGQGQNFPKDLWPKDATQVDVTFVGPCK